MYLYKLPGKTYLVDALARASGGLMFTATEALTQLFRAADRAQPTVAVLDEFPYLARSSPELPSLIQRHLDPGARLSSGQVRLLLCGSAMSSAGTGFAGMARLRRLAESRHGSAAFSGAGFSDELRDLAARSPEIVLVRPDRLYQGS